MFKEDSEKILSSYLAQPGNLAFEIESSKFILFYFHTSEPNQNQQVQPITVVHSSRPVSETQNTSTTCNIL